MPGDAKAIVDHFHVSEERVGRTVVTGRSAVVVRLEGATKQRELVVMEWGLRGRKSRGGEEGMLYARVEVVREKAAWREAWEKRRCLLPADGFYEWRKEEHQKLPYFVRLRNGHLFAFGGIWAGGEGEESCAILTTEGNELVRSLDEATAHHRMPVIIRPEHYDAWLDPGTPVERLGAMLQRYPAREMTAYPVEAMAQQEGKGEEVRAMHPVVEEKKGTKGGGNF